MIELFPQSGNDQFVYTSEAELFYENSELIPICQVCDKKVSYHEWNPKYTEFACHGNILRFYFMDGFLSRVEELKE